MAVSHFVKIDAAVDDVAVVRQIGEVIYSNQSTAVAAVCGVITEGFGSSLTADVIGRVAEDGTGLNVVKALKIHRGIDGDGERSLGVVHPVGIGGNGEDIFAVGSGREGVFHFHAALAIGVDHVPCRDHEHRGAGAVFELYAAGAGKLGSKSAGIESELIYVFRNLCFYYDVFLERAFGDDVLKVSAVEYAAVGKRRREVLRRDLCLEAAFLGDALKLFYVRGYAGNASGGSLCRLAHARIAAADPRREGDCIAVIAYAGQLRRTG